MVLPAELRNEIETSLSWSITGEKRLPGGDINQAAMIETADGQFFIKWNERAPDDMFEKEARGLDLLRSATDGLDIPNVIHWSPPSGAAPSYLLMEYLQSGPQSEQTVARFGESLAAMHNVENDTFGLDHNNYIGRLPQSNRPTEEWITFFINERIEPQMRRARDSGRIGNSSLRNWESLAGRLASIFPDTRPALTHGDLWSGNWFCGNSGRVALIDPAVYYGHPEMEIAFTRLFGRFPDPFYRAYNSVQPFEPGFSDRIPLYNLYPLLVHTNLFGGHYADSVSSILKRFNKRHP